MTFLIDDVISNIATLSVQIFARSKFWLKLRILVIAKLLGNSDLLKLVLAKFFQKH